jgi:hypothetical protein
MGEIGGKKSSVSEIGKSATLFAPVPLFWRKGRRNATLSGESGESEKAGNDQQRQPVVELMVNLAMECLRAERALVDQH